MLFLAKMPGDTKKMHTKYIKQPIEQANTNDLTITKGSPHDFIPQHVNALKSKKTTTT